MLFKIYRYINILSLDVAAGACICSMFIADFLDVDLPWATVSLLGISVWLIYTFDHLNDAKNIAHKASTLRHRFHQANFRRLIWVCILVLIVASFIIFRLPVETVIWGAALSCFVIGYFLLLYLLKLRSSYHKEAMIAVLYASGILLGPLSIYEGTMDIRVITIFGQFVLLAFTNLLAFALYEVHSDERDKSPSLVRVIGTRNATFLLKVLVALQVIVAVLLAFNADFLMVEFILFIMIILLGGVVFFRRYLMAADLYRIIGDAVFLLPVLGLFLNN